MPSNSRLCTPQRLGIPLRFPRRLRRGHPAAQRQHRRRQRRRRTPPDVRRHYPRQTSAYTDPLPQTQKARHMAVPRAEPLHRRNAAGRHQNPWPQRRRADCEQGRRKKAIWQDCWICWEIKKRIKQGRLKTGFQTALLSTKCQSQQSNNFTLYRYAYPSPLLDSSKINKNNLIIRYKIKNWSARLPYSPSIYKQNCQHLKYKFTSKIAFFRYNNEFPTAFCELNPCLLFCPCAV